eukprot:TRINITY_DN4601_c0_g1_i2.p1 TRINITY_DN4601_c0_g1~~TRINITY_DN4601_c0_g1_i2.p1  ORF type:complete len:870 (+),score=193.82 TRINITY_DN4601_c0_g1_i2:561-3170(+)
MQDRVGAVQLALRDLSDPIMTKSESADGSMLTPAEHAIGKVRDEWSQVMRDVRQVHDESAEPPGQTIVDTFSDALDLAHHECQSAVWPDVDAEFDELCNASVDLIVAGLELAEDIHAEFSQELMNELDIQDKAILRHFDLICDYLKAFKLRTEDRAAGGNDGGADEYRELEAEFVELITALGEACAQGDAQDVDDITASISNLTINVLSAAEELSLRLAEEAKNDLLRSIDRVFVLAERQASNTQLLVSNPSNVKAKQRLEMVNNDLRKAAGTAIGNMIRIRDSFTGGWLSGFSEWRTLVRDEHELRETREIPGDFSLTPRVGDDGLPVDVPADVAETRRLLLALLSAQAAARDGWYGEVRKRADVDALRLKRELDDKRHLRTDRLTGYDMKSAALARERLALEKEEQKELHAEAVKLEIARVREEARILEEAARRREEARIEQEMRLLDEQRQREQAEQAARDEAARLAEETRLQQEAARAAEQQHAAERQRREDEELERQLAQASEQQEAEAGAQQTAAEQALPTDDELPLSDASTAAQPDEHLELQKPDEFAPQTSEEEREPRPLSARSSDESTVLSRSSSATDLRSLESRSPPKAAARAPSRLSQSSASPQSGRATYSETPASALAPQSGARHKLMRGSVSEIVTSRRTHALQSGGGELPPIAHRTPQAARKQTAPAASRPRSASLDDPGDVTTVHGRWLDYVKTERLAYVPPPRVPLTPLKPKSKWTKSELQFVNAYSAKLPRIVSQDASKRKGMDKTGQTHQVDRKRLDRAVQIGTELKKLKRGTSWKPADPQRRKGLTNTNSSLRGAVVRPSPVDDEYYRKLIESLRNVDKSLPIDRRLAMRSKLIAQVRQQRLAKYASGRS